MGLYFTIGNRSSAAHWSYGGFHAFRVKISALAGINLNDMQGFDGNKKWSDLKDDIVPFLNHSDCDGSLSPQECKKIYPRLAELLNNMPEDDYDRKNGNILVENMKECVKRRVKLIFT